MATTALAFRDADPSEDDELARICCNAFLPIWLHNWFQCLDKPLATVQGTHADITRSQARRVAFYRAFISLNRAYRGDVIVAYTPLGPDSATTTTATTDAISVDADTADASITPQRSAGKVPSGQIAAVVFLLPPHARPSWGDIGTAIRAGYLQGLMGMSLRGFWRMVMTYESRVQDMIGRALRARNIADGRETGLLFVQICVRNPEWNGVDRGPARRLLDWGIRRWWERHGEMPCWLDCFSDESERAYRELGFELLDTCMLETHCDRNGIVLRKDAGEEEREQGRKVAKLRVMLRTAEKTASRTVR